LMIRRGTKFENAECYRSNKIVNWD
jgi:hypothetical protein